MKILLIAILPLLNIFDVCAQGYTPSVAKAIAASHIDYDDLDPITYKIGDVPDVLYWNYEKFLIDRMFLSGMKGSDKLYPELSSIEFLFVIKTQGEVMGKNYYGKWLLKDSVLYLRDIGFYDDRVYRYYSNQEQYKVMERFTGCKFQLDANSISTNLIPKESPLGSMRASCINGVFYVRKVRNGQQEKLKEWFDKPYYKLTFKHGMLISNETIKPDNSPKKNPRKRTTIPPYLQR